MMASRFRTIVGTGGVGTGLVFRSGSNRTLGRNESRLASLTDVRDYCKLHIVFHYLGKMLSPAAKIVAASIVGEDEAGDSCIAMMERAGHPHRLHQTVGFGADHAEHVPDLSR